MAKLSQIATIDILGVNVSAIDMADTVGFVGEAIARDRRTYICITGAHGLVECRGDAGLRTIHNEAGLVTPDGMPVVWCLRLLGAHGVSRVYGPDLMLDVSEKLRDAGVRHFYYGGPPGLADRLAQKMQARVPGLNVAGTCSPPFHELSDAELDEICADINASGADIVWVGLSTPKQERWMARARARLAAPVLVGVGAAFDIHAGTKRQAPRWMRRNGLEWLFRTLTEPRRLGRRYLKVVPTFGILALRQVLAARLGG